MKGGSGGRGRRTPAPRWSSVPAVRSCATPGLAAGCSTAASPRPPAQERGEGVALPAPQSCLSNSPMGAHIWPERWPPSCSSGQGHLASGSSVEGVVPWGEHQKLSLLFVSRHLCKGLSCPRHHLLEGSGAGKRPFLHPLQRYLRSRGSHAENTH